MLQQSDAYKEVIEVKSIPDSFNYYSTTRFGEKTNWKVAVIIHPPSGNSGYSQFSIK